MHRTILGVLLSAGAMLAQTTGQATIIGNITDSTGAVMAGAKVVVVSTERQFNYNATSNGEGYYILPYLQPGVYNMTVESPGFKRYVRNGIELRAAEQPRLDVRLEVGNVTESVEVTGAAPLLETETSVGGGLLDGETITKIPVVQKLTFRILPYLPGTQVINGLHIGGQRERAMGYALDGLGAKEPVTGAVGSTNRVVTSSIDAMSEVKAYTNGLPAEFGHSAGGQLAAIFKSGANAFHGSLEDRYINKKLLHRNYFDILRPTQPFTYHEISAVLSGPVLIPKLYNGKDKTFWLFGIARHHEKASETGINDVPSQEMLNGDFNFGGLGNQIYDPATMRQVNGAWTSDPFPNRTVPKARFDPAIVNFLGRSPFTPANAAGFTDRLGPHQNIVIPTTYRSYRTRFDIKVDHSFSGNHKIFGRYSQSHHTAFRDRWVYEANWRLIDGNAIRFPIDQPNLVISDTITLSPTLINEFRFGTNRRKTTRDPESVGQGWAKQLGIPNVSDETFPEFRGTNTYNNALFFRTGPGGRSSEVWEDFTIQDNLTKVLGKHTIKGGYELMRTRYNLLAEALPSGRYYMSGTELPFSPAQSSGHDFANLLLGTVQRAEYTKAMASWLPRWWGHSLYVQDDFKPFRGLTVNLGLRWTYESPFNTKYNQHSQFDPTAIDSITRRAGAIVHGTGPLAKKDLNNFQPRIGLAWNFRPKMVLRSNFGMMTQDLFVTNLSQQFEEYFATASLQSPVGDPRPTFRLSQGPPSFAFNVSPDGSVPFIGTNFGGRNASWLDPNLRMPYIMNWATGVQWEFMTNLLTEVQYQGNAGVGLLNNWDINVVPLNVSNDFNTLDNIRRNYQNFRPYPQFGSIQNYSNYGHNTYHSVTGRIERRYKNGLFMNAFFTFSKSLTDSEGDGGVSGVTFYNRRLEKSRASYDISKRFVAVAIYEMPYGKGRKHTPRNKFMNGLLGGWDLMVSQTIMSGPPITVNFSNPNGVYLPGQLRPNQIAPNNQAVTQNWDIGANRFPTTAQNRYLNPEAFAYPANFTAGSLGRNTLESPGMIWMQTSLSKEFPIYERLKFIIRWDMNNPYKRNNFGDPNRTYNVNNQGPFGRFGGDRGSFGDIGGRLHSFLVARLEW